MIDTILKTAEEKMKNTLSSLTHDYDQMRTGRASASILDNVKVEAYGDMVPISSLATLSTPEARLLVISPWDKNTLGAIEKAILAANLGFNPANDGKVLRIMFSALSKERRAELCKEAQKMAETHKVTLRNIRREGIDEAKKLEKNKEISEDVRKDCENKIQNLTDKYTESITTLCSEKEKSLTTLG